MSLTVPARIERMRCALELVNRQGGKLRLSGGIRMLVNMKAHGMDGATSLSLGECTIAVDREMMFFPHQEWHGVVDEMVEWLDTAHTTSPTLGTPQSAKFPSGARFGHIHVSLYGMNPGDAGAFVETLPFRTLACFFPRNASLDRIVVGVPGNLSKSLGGLHLDVEREMAGLSFWGDHV